MWNDGAGGLTCLSGASEMDFRTDRPVGYIAKGDRYPPRVSQTCAGAACVKSSHVACKSAQKGQRELARRPFRA